MFKSLVLAALLLFSSVATAGIPASDTGAYFDPLYNGSGVFFLGADAKESNAVVSIFTWYTYTSDGKQQWFVGVEQNTSESFTYFRVYKPKGFNILTVGHDFGDPVGSATARKVEGGYVFTWDLNASDDFCDGFSPQAPWCGGTYNLIKL